MDENYSYDDPAMEDIAHLEDRPETGMEDYENTSMATPSAAGDEAAARAESAEPIKPDTPLYRLRLAYSHETFIAACEGERLPTGSTVIAPTRFGRDLAQIIGPVSNNGFLKPSEIVRIERLASEAELEKARQDAAKEEEAFRVCRQKIDAHRLDMKLVSVHYLMDEPKVLFFFTAETRVDFRELVKDLVGIFKTRIELRQIGVRDESRVVGGLGVCGRGYCCHAVSDKLKPVSIKMAKDQNLSLNSMKISGPCGRLLCCLAYEHGFYSEQRRQMPPEGCKIAFQNHTWKVVEVNPVSGKLKIVSEDGRQLNLGASTFERVEGRWRILESAFPGEPSEPMQSRR